MTNKITGKHGEEIAKNFLIKNGYKILETNFHYSKLAEIDIIAQKNKTIHFIEVKTRTQNFYGSPLEAITPQKLSSIYKCAKYYLGQKNINHNKIQIDAIGIILNNKEVKDLKFIENISL